MLKGALTLFYLAIVFTSLTACHKKAAQAIKTAEQPKEEFKSLIIDGTVDITNTGDLYTIDSLAINKDILSVFIKHGGGCTNHNYDLYFRGKYAKSYPMQASLCLKHDANGDKCKKLILNEIKFNISNLKLPDNNTIIVSILDKSVTYNYN